MFAVEDGHWWFAGKRRLVGVLLDALRLPADARILDVGCGTGGMFQLLRRYGSPVGVDQSEIALSFSRRRTLQVARAILPDLPFRDETFDLVTIFDVLYHRRVDDDVAAARELRRVLKPGGALVVTDSALAFLRGAHDVAMHGARRYTTSEIRKKLTDAGFEVRRASYANCLLFPVAAPWRLLQRLTSREAHSDVAPAPAWVNRTLGGVYATEAWLLRRMNLPIGTSIAAVATKA